MANEKHSVKQQNQSVKFHISVPGQAWPIGWATMFTNNLIYLNINGTAACVNSLQTTFFQLSTQVSQVRTNHDECCVKNTMQTRRQQAAQTNQHQLSEDIVHSRTKDGRRRWQHKLPHQMLPAGLITHCQQPEHCSLGKHQPNRWAGRVKKAESKAQHFTYQIQ